MTQIMSHIFLVCFVVGLVLSIVGLLFGMHTGHDFHIGHIHFDFGGHDMGHGGDLSHGGDMGHGHGHGDAGHGTNGESSVSFFSYYGLVMFVTWFGGVGLMLNRHTNGMLVIVLLGAIAAGFVGAGAVFYFLRSFLIKGETRMRESDYYLPGTLARVCSSIPADGTGEIMYVQGGTRKTLGARAEDGVGFKQGDEVLIIRYERGIAYVKSVAGDLEGASMP